MTNKETALKALADARAHLTGRVALAYLDEAVSAVEAVEELKRARSKPKAPTAEGENQERTDR